MLTTLIVCLCLAINLHAEDTGTHSSSATSISTSTKAAFDSSLSSEDAITSSSSLVDVNEELTKIATTCLSAQDVELLVGNAFKHHVVGMFIHVLVKQSVDTIGLRELRTALKLPALPPWKPLNRTEPREHELESATTTEEYYNLKEPRSKMGSLDSEFLFEHNVDTAVTYLNKRLPSIRTIFKRVFEEICPSAPEVLDKKAIDRMIEVYNATLVRMSKATSQMVKRYECWDDI